MNSKSFQDQTALTSIGIRLRQAENIGLSQQAVVAKQLCSKLPTVRDIEDDHTYRLHFFTRLYQFLCTINIPEE